MKRKAPKKPKPSKASKPLIVRTPGYLSFSLPKFQVVPERP